MQNHPLEYYFKLHCKTILSTTNAFAVLTNRTDQSAGLNFDSISDEVGDECLVLSNAFEDLVYTVRSNMQQRTNKHYDKYIQQYKSFVYIRWVYSSSMFYRFLFDASSKPTTVDYDHVISVMNFNELKQFNQDTHIIDHMTDRTAF